MIVGKVSSLSELDVRQHNRNMKCEKLFLSWKNCAQLTDIFPRVPSPIHFPPAVLPRALAAACQKELLAKLFPHSLPPTPFICAIPPSAPRQMFELFPLLSPPPFLCYANVARLTGLKGPSSPLFPFPKHHSSFSEAGEQRREREGAEEEEGEGETPAQPKRRAKRRSSFFPRSSSTLFSILRRPPPSSYSEQQGKGGQKSAASPLFCTALPPPPLPSSCFPSVRPFPLSRVRADRAPSPPSPPSPSPPPSNLVGRRPSAPPPRPSPARSAPVTTS